ncbi:MAG TPA: FAD-binding oxidoreductase, partial [Armatimonadota bacterium]|nr:FAD-binding oxidoreductase [Armatimonadota bacterium]
MAASGVSRIEIVPEEQANKAHTRRRGRTLFPGQPGGKEAGAPRQAETLEAIGELEKDLQANVRGEVRFSPGARAMYATDGSNYRQVPLGVVLPLDKEDLATTVAICHRYGAPITMRGCGTSLAGQTCNVSVVIDTSKYMNHILEINPEQRYARIEPGVILDDLRNAAEAYHLTYGPDPATHTHCTLGGMIGNNSCGIHSVYAGKTVENVEALEILTYDGQRMWVGPTSEDALSEILNQDDRQGEIYRGLKEIRDRYADQIRARYPKIPRRVSGYNLDELLPENGFNVARALVGTESTGVVILEAKVRLVYSPPARSLLVLGYPDVYHAGDHILEVLEGSPIALEGLDDLLVEDMKIKNLHPRNLTLLPEGNGWLLVEFGGQDKHESDDRARALMKKLAAKSDAPTMKLFDDPAQEHLIWTIRESGLGATADVPGRPKTWPGWEDSAVPPDKVGAYLRDLRKLFDKFGYHCDLYGHFGQGCVHVRIDFDLLTSEGIARYRQFMSEATDLVVSYGGSLSGEHGDGQSRAQFLTKMFGEELVGVFHDFKKLWDPDLKMNPGKVVSPYQIDQNLRLGAEYNPPHQETYFKFPEDDGSFSRVAQIVQNHSRLDEG